MAKKWASGKINKLGKPSDAPAPKKQKVGHAGVGTCALCGASSAVMDIEGSNKIFSMCTILKQPPKPLSKIFLHAILYKECEYTL
eukprot:2098207-Amphidinium_carterae.1